MLGMDLSTRAIVVAIGNQRRNCRIQHLKLLNMKSQLLCDTSVDEIPMRDGTITCGSASYNKLPLYALPKGAMIISCNFESVIGADTCH